MSDSDHGLPPDSQIEQCFRRVVRDALKRQEDITVNSVRAAVEEELDIPTDFFKDDVSWKKRSKEIINSAVDGPPSPEKPISPHASARKAGTKRKSTTPQPPTKKRQKKSPEISKEDEDEIEVAGKSSVPVRSATNGRKGSSGSTKQRRSTKSEEESSLSEAPSEEDNAEPTAVSNSEIDTAPVDTGHESDLSSVIDVTPPKKKRPQKPPPSSTKNGHAKPAKTKPEKPTAPLTSDEEEVKRLQSWLLKCGIRKLWHRELAPYDTAKDKIRHLKNMLTDVGMTGRFSAEKARSIKEARELAAELEAAQEFNEHWGHSAGEDDDADEDVGGDQTSGPPKRRRKPKGLIDFSDSDEGSD